MWSVLEKPLPLFKIDDNPSDIFNHQIEKRSFSPSKIGNIFIKEGGFQRWHERNIM